jgi:electron transfer flavoprotein alpha subunit
VSAVLAVGWGDGAPDRPGSEALGGAVALAAQLGVPALYASLGDPPEPGAEAAAASGVRALAVRGGAGDVESLTAQIAALIEEFSPLLVLLAGDDRGGQLAPRVAARAGGVGVNNATFVEVRDGRLHVTRPVFGGKALCRLVPLRFPAVVSLRSRTFEPAVAAPGGSVESRLVVVETRVRVIERTPAAPEDGRLEDARVVVSGGRGMGGAEAFSGLEKLAGALGGVVGASLAAVDEGWAPPSRQIGLTGKVVSPELYVAVGISGASQHLAGLASGVILAINNNAKAPIFESAQLGLVGDAKLLVPALISALQAARG